MRKYFGKKMISVFCGMMMAAALLSGCSGSDAGKKTAEAQAEKQETEAAPKENKAEESTAKENTAEKTESSYPEKEIQCIVTAAAGGGTDAMARAVCTPLEQRLGKSIVIINNGSAGGMVGMGEISQAEPDGYTLGVFSNTDVANFAYGSDDCGFTVDDFTYIAALNTTGDVLILKKDSDLTDLNSFIEYAKANPGQMTIALPSAIQNLSLNLMNEKMGIETTGVVYEGGNKVMADLLGGHIDAGILSAKFISQAEEQGLTVLGIMLKDRLSTFPDTPTFTEQGYEISNPASRMLVGPKGLSAETVDVLVESLKAGYEAEIAESVSNISEAPLLLTGTELDDFLKADFAMREGLLKK